MRIYFILIFCILNLPAFAQVVDDPIIIPESPLSFEMDTELGILSFDNADGEGERYLSSVLAPVIKQGMYAAGFRLRWRWNRKGMRDEDYNEFSDYLAIIRFLQYSDKDEPGYYLRLGDIDHTQIGYGQFLNRYRNTLSLDTPHTGLIVDHNTDQLQFEGLYSSLASPEVYAVRLAYKPFLTEAEQSRRHLSLGATLAGDLSEDARWVNSNGSKLPFLLDVPPLAADTLGIGIGEEKSPLTLIGFDAGIPFPSKRFSKLEAYAELGNIIGFGSGLGLGILAEKEKDQLSWKGWLEQRLLGKEYVPSYFNSRYEADRIRTTTVTLADGSEMEALQSKRNLLRTRDEMEFGSFLGMEFRFSKYYRLRWSLEQSWTRKGSGWFQLDFRITEPSLPFQIRYVFDRVNMDGLGDIIYGPSENSLIRLELAYLFKEHMLVGFRYRQSFERTEHLGQIIGRRKRTRIEPALIIRL